MNKGKKLILLVLFIIVISCFMTGCMPGDGSKTLDDPAGFMTGVWHGWIAPFSLVFGIFDKNIRLYEVMNKGWLYDFGFYIAIISGFGGLSLSRKNKNKKD